MISFEQSKILGYTKINKVSEGIKCHKMVIKLVESPPCIPVPVRSINIRVDREVVVPSAVDPETKFSIILV